MGRRSGGDVQRSVWTAGLVVLVLGPTLLASIAGAQVCGDADGSGTTTVSDGVQVLRAAAGLATDCTGRICDVDGDGTTTVTDGVAMLRRAAQLPADVSCGTRFGTLVKTIVVGGVPADLQIGDPPTPENGAPQNVFLIDGPTKVQSGQVASFAVQLSRPVDSLVIAFQENGSFVDGFAELPVAGNPGPIQLALTFGQANTTTDLKVAGRLDGKLGVFQTRPLSIVDLDVIAGPIEYGGHNYLLLSEGGWVDSEAEAVSLGGHLVTINDDAENNFVSATFQHVGGVSRSLWIGLYDAASEGTFTWTSGEPITYTAWCGNCPNNCCGGENYIHMMPDVCGWTGGARWNDLSDRPLGALEPCGTPINGVVEVP